MFKSPMWITPLPPSLTALGGKVHMAQFSMEIVRLTGSVLRGNQHLILKAIAFWGAYIIAAIRNAQAKTA
jgi:hypothetical protein